jgi:hypothetical protein
VPDPNETGAEDGALDGPDALASAPADEIGFDAPAETASGFLPAEPRRLASESVLVRVIATLGVIGIGTAVGAILVANTVAGWITGLVVSALSVVLAAVLWRSRRL